MRNRGQCLTNYGYYNYDGEKEKYIVLKTFKDKATDWKMPAKQYYMIHSAVEFCGDTIFSSQPIEVETHKELSATTTVSTCKIVGNEVTIKAVEDGCDCKIIRGDEVFASVDGVSTAKIKLTEKKEYKYDVIVKSEETGCQVTLHKSIKESEIKDRKTSVEIGPSGVAAQTNVCAGTEIPLTSTKNDNEYASYSWSVNGDIKTGETKNTLNFTFPEAGKSYKVKRTCYYYEGTELCYTVTDSTTIETVGALEVPAIALSEDSVCNGEDVEVTVTAKGGGSGTVYDLVLMPGNLSQDKSVSKDGSLVFKVNKLTSDSTLYAVVTDNTCTNKNIYKAESQKAKVTVEKDLTMVIKPANSMITTEDFKDGKTTVSVVLENVSSGDVITYFLSNASTTTASTTITYNGSAFSLTIDSTMFDPDQKTVDLKVQRRGAKVGKCECSATYPFRLNEGFLGTPIIISNDKTDMIEVCAGQEVELSVDNANEITFGERSILEMADAQWKWFYGNSPMATGNTYKFTVDAGRAYSYTVVFSGKDAGGRTRRISSTPFIVKGGAGMKVGGISFEGYEQNYIEFCKGSKSEVAMSCGLDPDKVAMKWEYSHTAAVDDWAAVPAEWNGNKTTVAKSISVGVNNLGNKKTYFRVAAVDNCNTKSQSDNYLSVSFKTDVENPRVSIASSTLYSSDQPLPDSISFNRYYYHDEPYMFLGRGEVENLEGKKQKVFFGDDLHFGVNSVSVVRSEKAKISEEVCMSDTVDYTFSIYKKLTKPSLGGPADNFFCPNDGQTKYMFIVLNNSTGGDSATYKTTWQYKLKNSDDWWIDAEGSHYKDNNHYRYSYKWESVKVTDGLEWSFNKTSWNSCNGFYINEVLPEVRYGNQYNVTFTFESKSIEIDANKLWTDGVMKNDYAKKEFDEKGTITLYFRFSNSVEVKYEMNSGNIGTMTGYFHQGSEYAKLITINRCNAGTLKVNGEGKNPAINNNPENGYAIYEEQTSNIDVTSFVEQHEGSEVVDLVDDSRESKPQNSQLLKGQIDNSIEISYFTYSSLKLIPGKEFTVQRKIVNGSCRSNTLKFKVLPKPIIEGINEDRDHTYCHSGKIPVAGTSVGVHYSTNGDGFATLYGKKCVLGNYNQYMSTYGIKYQWEYWTDFNPVPQTIPLLESDDMVPGSPLQIYDGMYLYDSWHAAYSMVAY